MKILLLFVLSVLFVVPIHAADRVALVIGNGSYQNGSSLPNPVPDAQLVAARLTALGFQVIPMDTCTDLTKRDFNRRLTAFATAAQGAEVALFYFAGHGVMGAGDKQYLLPTDVVLEQEADFATEAIAADDIITTLTQTQVKAKVLILDCCRNNPFAQDTRVTRTWLSRDSTDGGLAAIQAELPQGTAVMFSAAPGKKAKDGPPGGNSPFATALCATLGRAGSDGKTPDTIFNTMLGVAEAVEIATSTVIDGKPVKQEPYLKFDGKPQLLARLSFSQSYSVPPPISMPTPTYRPPPVDDDYTLLAGKTAGERKLIEVAAGVTVAFRWCPAGTFTMGSPESEHAKLKAAGKEPSFYEYEVQHSVTLTKGFWLAETEVTQGQWQGVMGTTVPQQANKALADDTVYNSMGDKTYRAFVGQAKGEGSELIAKSTFVESEKVAMYFVNCEDADEFCTKASRHAGQRGWAIALPTEAQWEYACRSGSIRTTYAGDFTIKGENNAPGLDAIAWHGGNNSEGYSGTAGPRRVGAKQANEWGLSDMLGNVWEWCADYYGPYGSSATNPQGATTGADRVNRGGSWNVEAAYCRAAHRGNHEAGIRSSFLGFRPALVPSR